MGSHKGHRDLVSTYDWYKTDVDPGGGGPGPGQVSGCGQATTVSNVLLPQGCLSCSYEAACEEYTKALGLLHSSEDEEDDRGRSVRASQHIIVEFVVNEVHMYVCIYVCKYVCTVPVCTYICMYIHTVHMYSMCIRM